MIFSRYAIRYARQGYPVFPLALLSKEPPWGTHGLSDATTDERQIAEWGRLYPDGNIGLATGPDSFDVVDVDTKGFATERALQAEGKHWPDTPIQLTRSGGRHILVQHHDMIVTGTDRLGRGIDFRGAGGYIAVAPSRVRDKRMGVISGYSWPYWPKTGIAPAPAWMIEYIIADAEKRKAEAQERSQNTVQVDARSCSDRERLRWTAIAASMLDWMPERLAQQVKPGRGKLLYTYAGFLAPYVRSGFVNETDVRSSLEGACRANGLVRDNGINDVRKTVTRAFEHSTSKLADLGKLGDRPYRRAA